MDYKTMDRLLEQYFEGLTTYEEELTLQEYFAGAEVAPEHEMYRPLFDFYESEKTLTTTPDFEQRLFEKIQPIKQEAVIRKINRRWLSIAAALALVIGTLAVMKVWNIPDPAAPADINWAQYEPENPEEAYEEMVKALALVSEKMNEGEAQTLKGLKKFKQASEKAQTN